MWNEFNYINIREVLSRVTRHPLMQDISLEAGIQYTIDFIGIMGLPNLYENKIESICIEQYRGLLPCDCISINQVMHNNQCLRHMTDNFNGNNNSGEESFKTQGNIIYTSFKDGSIDISYKSIRLDCDGFPMIPDNPIFLKALEEYIKKEWFTILFDMGKISPAVLQNVQQSYAFRAGQLNSSFLIPSPSEMESITRMMNTLIPRVKAFNDGFKNYSNQEYIKKH